jgi:transposase
MPLPSSPDSQHKRQTLHRHGTLNRRPEAVTGALFQDGGFFDPDDLAQVKYEMLRQVYVDNHSVSESARVFGLSRRSFYQAQAALQQDGLFGLLPHKRGPQGGHKLTAEVMEFVMQQRAADASLTAPQLVESVWKRFQVQVHPRSIHRQLLRQEKRS